MKFLDRLSWAVLLPLAILLGLAPFYNAQGQFEPHLLQKINMLMAGELSKPLDIFDMLMHAALPVVALLKAIREFGPKGS